MDEIQENMCRLCLEISSDMENIFDSEHNYIQIIEELTGLKVSSFFLIFIFIYVYTYK